MEIRLKVQEIPGISVAIKGAGDLASGIACCLFRANILNIRLMEIANPIAVRRKVSFSEAVYDGEMTVEGITATLANSTGDVQRILNRKKIPILIDPLWNSVRINIPDVLIDAIMAKKNTGTKVDDAQLVIGLGPGFYAGQDVDYVIETKRGHNLARVVVDGRAQKNTSIPEEVNNFTVERVVRSPITGLFRSERKIGDIVRKGEPIGQVDGIQVNAEINGIIRGLIRSNIHVAKSMKIADVDPRSDKSFCYSTSDKARSLGGAVLETILRSLRLDP